MLSGLTVTVFSEPTTLLGVSIEFLLPSPVVAAIPGTEVVYTVSSAIGVDRRRGLVAALGCTLGIVPHILAAMLGLSGVMQAGALAFEVVRWASVAYIVYMGISMIRDGGSLTVFFAFLPQFLDAPSSLFDAQLVWLGGVLCWRLSSCSPFTPG